MPVSMSHAPFVDGMLRACIHGTESIYFADGTALAVPSPLAGEGQGGGYRLLRCLQYRKNNSFQIFYHIIVGEAKYTIAARRKPLVAPRVMTKAPPPQGRRERDSSAHLTKTHNL
jgi:hypothetical protein